MKYARRNFLNTVGLASAAPMLLRAMSFDSQQTSAADQGALDFWTSDVRQPAGGRGLFHEKSRITRRATFLFYGKESEFQPASEVSADDLPDDGDVGLVLRINSFRPSASDGVVVNDSKCSSLRLDLQQGVPLEGLTEPLAWTAVASMFTADKKFSDYRDFSFDPKSAWGKLPVVPLPSGIGFWTWNFFVQKHESLWGRVMKTFGQASNMMGSLGLPGIAETALKAVDGLVGFLQSRESSDWLLQSVNIPFFGTKAGRARIPGRALPLKTGDYIVLAEEHASALIGHKDLELVDGLLVPRRTTGRNLSAVAAEVLPQISYLCFSVSTPALRKRSLGE